MNKSQKGFTKTIELFKNTINSDDIEDAFDIMVRRSWIRIRSIMRILILLSTFWIKRGVLKSLLILTIHEFSVDLANEYF